MDWHFRSRSHHCDDCEAAFEDKQPYHTILFRGMESLERRDICPGCWEQKHETEPGAIGGYISHWQGVYEVPPPPPLREHFSHPETCGPSQKGFIDIKITQVGDFFVWNFEYLNPLKSL